MSKREWTGPGPHVACSRIKARRQGQGLNINKLAELAGIPAHVLTSIEAGHIAVPPADALYKLAVALGCTMEHLLDEPELPRFEPDADGTRETPMAKENLLLRRKLARIGAILGEGDTA